MRSPLLGAAGATLGTLATLGGITFLVSNIAMLAVRTAVKQRKVGGSASSNQIAPLPITVHCWLRLYYVADAGGYYVQTL